MRNLFYTALIGLSLFEILKVYFIMPMPGSQRLNSIEVAYFLHTWRWVFRMVFLVLALAGSYHAFRVKMKWIPALAMLFTAAVFIFFNFKMMADKMFLQPENVVLKNLQENKVLGSRLVIGIENKGEAKAYPIQFLAYHHQVLDTVGDAPVIVTYCNVCRTGRVFEPIVNGYYETFRLVGMNHFNAMFEDATTGSWWRQSTGEAITGKLKGHMLPEKECMQLTVDKWFELYPNGMVMQQDEASIEEYDSLAKFEQGLSKSKLTRTDSLSWKDKSWVIGVKVGNSHKAYDWNDLKMERIINDTVGQTAIVLALSSDGKSFAAFERQPEEIFTIQSDTLFSDSIAYDFSGRGLSHSKRLKRVQAYQEFWHSWKTFQPDTRQYSVKNQTPDQ